MTGEDAPISTPPGLRVEELFKAMLEADTTLTGLHIVAASNRDALVPPLHCFVFCPQVNPVLSFGQNYRCEVIVAVVSNIDDTNHATRRDWAAKVLKALTKTDQPYSEADAVLQAWPIKELSEASTDQQAADIITLTAIAAIAG